ncbi:TPA: hypothetical protein RJ115_004307 [Yersinia enterocolitica]|nr:hypothetical protein [Yersinia enterocolitica]
MDKSDSKKNTYVSLPKGWSIEPLYQRCPRCNFDLNKVPQTIVDQINADQAKNGTNKTKCSFVTFAHKVLATYLAYFGSKWMVLPFTTANKNATKRDQQGGLTGEVGKQSGTSAKKNDGAD